MDQRFNKFAFLEKIMDLSWDKMIQSAEKEANHVESISYGVKGAIRNRELGSPAYIRFLSGLLYWLRNGVKPYDLSYDEFQSLRPLCVKLIEKQQLKPEALNEFELRKD